ncbi:MAG: hypothetical protein MJB12_21320 [Firmicutes bacterium]|nr:hypothetical protein [Bacillota bacterium]
MLRSLNVKFITILILVTGFICLIAAYKIGVTTQRLPASQCSVQQTL